MTDGIFDILVKKNIAVEEKSTTAEMIESIINYYEDIIDAMPGNVYWLDRNAVTVGCNRNVLNMYGLKSSSDFKGLNFDQQAKICGWSDKAKLAFLNDTKEVIITGKPKLNIEEPPIPDENGNMIYFLTSRVPLFDETKKVIGVIGISVDITERKKTEKELKIAKEQAEAASYAKSEFIANMSHDLRTPLTGMIGMAETIATDSREEDIQIFAQDLTKSGKRLLELANDILEIVETDINSLQNQENESFSLKKLLREIKELFIPSLTHKNLDFELNFDDQIPLILFGGKNLIHRTLTNLIGNAIKFTDKGKIALSAKLLKNENDIFFIEMSVADTGVGVPKEKQEIIFEPFTKLSASYQGIYKGNGLGLYLVKSFIEKLQGTIKIHSVLKKGTKFVIIIPMRETKKVKLIEKNEKLEKIEEKEKKLIESKVIKSDISFFEKKQYRILVVEDDVIAAKVMSMYLKYFNCKVDICVTGKSALKKIKSKLYDIIYMDIGLPDIDGCKVTQKIREWEKETEKNPIPIIALTAHIDKAGKKRCFESGLNSVINKPASKDIIRKHINQFLESNSKNLNPLSTKKISLDELPVIDWQHGINAYKNPAIQKQLLEMFKDELTKSLLSIHRHYKNKNWKELLVIVHKFKGSSIFCGAARLKSVTTELNKLLSSNKKDENKVKIFFNLFLLEIDSFLNLYKESINNINFG